MKGVFKGYVLSWHNIINCVLYFVLAVAAVLQQVVEAAARCLQVAAGQGTHCRRHGYTCRGGKQWDL